MGKYVFSFHPRHDIRNAFAMDGSTQQKNDLPQEKYGSSISFKKALRSDCSDLPVMGKNWAVVKPKEGLGVYKWGCHTQYHPIVFRFTPKLRQWSSRNMTSDLFLDWHLRTKAPTVTKAIFQSGANASARTKPGSTDWALQEENDKRSKTIRVSTPWSLVLSTFI